MSTNFRVWQKPLNAAKQLLLLGTLRRVGLEVSDSSSVFCILVKSPDGILHRYDLQEPDFGHSVDELLDRLHLKTYLTLLSGSSSKLSDAD
jgi:hypothetical protein